MSELIAKIREYFLNDKKKIIIFVVALVGVLLMLLTISSEKNEPEENISENYKEELEEELTKLCSQIDGVGKCRVSVSFSVGESYKYSGNKLISTTPPKVDGVVVIAEGADKTNVKKDIIECMTSLFDIGTNRVCVMKMEK